MKYPFAIKHGDKLAVLRPDDPQLALKLAYAASEIEDEEAGQKAFREILTSQPYTFVGLLAQAGRGGSTVRLLDEAGWSIGSLRPGDSFVPYSDIVAHAAAATAGDPSVVVTDDENQTSGFRYEVQEDGTLGPVRDPSTSAPLAAARQEEPDDSSQEKVP